MTSDRNQRLYDLFAEAREQPPDVARQMIELKCADDSTLRSELLALLDAHSAAGPFLRQPAVAAAIAPDPTRVGPYAITSRLGEGGFAIVYLAEQVEPLKRRVALKVLKRGMDTDAVLRRFDIEKETLAFLDHPGIAKVYDAGVTDDGRPYFAMQLVEGVPITRFCDERAMTIDDRLTLFRALCDAVSHAHTKGVIHRDLKPANILVSAGEGGMPRPIVIDFGVAKAIDRSIADAQTRSNAPLLLGTPEYMSPEQARGIPGDVDVRSDVYSLGVVLYELLTGRRPLEGDALRAGALGDVQRMIAEHEVTRPSVRIASEARSAESKTRARAESASQSRGATPAVLAHRLARELDWIVLRALEKDRERRYTSVSNLARDIQNVLEDAPVEARSPSRVYALRKFVRRHRVAVGAGAAVFLALGVGMGVAMWQAERASLAEAREAKRAEGERRQRVLAEQTQSFWNGVTRRVASLYGGEKATVLQAIEAAQAQLDQSASESLLSRASQHHLLAQSYFALSNYPKAQVQATLAADLFSRALGSQSAQAAIARWDAALSGFPQGDPTSLDEMQSSLETILTAGDASAPENWERMASLAALLANSARREDAQRWLDRLQAQRTKAGDSEQSRTAAHVSMAMAQMAESPDEGTGYWRRAVEIFSSLLGPDHVETLEAKGYLAFHLSYAKQDNAAAAEAYRDQLEGLRRVYAAPHPAIADACKEMSACLSLMDRVEEAERAAREAIAAYAQLGMECDRRRSLDALLALQNMYARLKNTSKFDDLTREADTLRVRCTAKGTPLAP